MADQQTSIKYRKGPFLTPITISSFFLVLSIIAICVFGIELFRHNYGDNIIGIYLLLSVFIITEKVQSLMSAISEERFREVGRAGLDLIHDRIVSESNKLEDIVFSSVETTCIGSHNEALAYCATRIRLAKRMKDTYFRNEPDMTIRGYDQNATAYQGAVLDLIKSGGSVEAVVANVNLNQYVKSTHQSIGYVLDHDVLVRFQVFVVEQGRIPVINMVILNYMDYSEVLFGWNYSNTDDGIVFSSKDEKVIRYFEALFDRVKTVSDVLDIKNLVKE